MWIAGKVVSILVIGIMVVLGFDGYFSIRRDIALFDTGMRRDARLLGDGMRRLLADVWESRGQDRAMEVVELVGRAGFDYVVVDLEHSPLDLETAYRLIFAAQACGMAALVRVPDRSGSHVQRVLDAGADGILVPQVSSVAEATAAAAISSTSTSS